MGLTIGYRDMGHLYLQGVWSETIAKESAMSSPWGVPTLSWVCSILPKDGTLGYVYHPELLLLDLLASDTY